MAEERTTRTQHEELDPDAGFGKQARALARDLSPDNVERRLEEAVDENPLLRYILDLGVVARAVALAAVGALIVWLLAGPVLAALVLVVLFFGAWLMLATIRHDRRRETAAVQRGS